MMSRGDKTGAVLSAVGAFFILAIVSSISGPLYVTFDFSNLDKVGSLEKSLATCQESLAGKCDPCPGCQCVADPTVAAFFTGFIIGCVFCLIVCVIFGKHFNRIFEEYVKPGSMLARNTGLTRSALKIMVYLKDNDKMSVKEICADLGLRKATIRDSLDILQEAGFVKLFTQGRPDYALSEKGGSLMEKHADVFARVKKGMGAR